MSSSCRTCGTAGCADTAHGASDRSAVKTIALAGNPNVGKTSVFNALTGLRQHTGNWPGKTVLRAEGAYSHNDRRYTVVDLPGTYSLSPNSAEEEVARDFICFGQPDVTVVVVDATALERNLNLALQVAEITSQLVVCVNLLDEARRKKITVDLEKLERELGVPVVGTVARTRRGISELKDMISRVAAREIIPQPQEIRYSQAIEKAVAEITPQLELLVDGKLSRRWVALRILEGDSSILSKIAEYLAASQGFLSPPVRIEV